jgi:hypothetical protein
MFVTLQESVATMGTGLSHVHRVPDRHTLRQNVDAFSHVALFEVIITWSDGSHARGSETLAYTGRRRSEVHAYTV